MIKNVGSFALLGLLVGSLAAQAPADYRGKPWKRKPQELPGRLTLAFYDEGGEGIAYHDADPVNHGSGQLNKGPAEKDNFRKNEGVDISYTKTRFDLFTNGTKLPLDMYYVGWTHQGEWLHYTIDVKEAGTYQVNILASSYKNPDEKITLSVNGKDKCSFTLEETGDYHRWKMFNTVAESTLDKGVQLLKLTIEKQQHATNLCYIEVVPRK